MSYNKVNVDFYSPFSTADGKFQLTISATLNITKSYTILSTGSNNVIKVFRTKLNTSKTRPVLSGRTSSVELSPSENAEKKDR